MLSAGRPADPDGTGGFFQPGLVGGAGTPTSGIEVRIVCALPSVTQQVSQDFEQRYRANVNPTIQRVERRFPKLGTEPFPWTFSTASTSEVVVTAPTQTAKRCVDCGADVAHRSREKLPTGDYLCRRCAARDRKERRSRLALRRLVPYAILGVLLLVAVAFIAYLRSIDDVAPPPRDPVVGSGPVGSGPVCA